MSGKKELRVAIRDRSGSDDSSGLSIEPPSLKSPRTARFAEATAVNSPVEPSQMNRLPFAQPPTQHYMAQPQVSDVGFGYVNKHESVEMPNTDDYQPPLTAKTLPKTPLPLKSAMKTPGAPPRDMNAIFSPTFKEEETLEKTEAFTTKQQAKDIKVKTRVRIAKFLLRGVNFSCSLIVLAMLSTTFSIFNATKAIPPRNSLPPWAIEQKTWPQVTLLCISCVSLFAAMLVFWGYYRGGHRRAEKSSVYYTAFGVAFFIFSIIMWAVGAAVLQHSKATSNGKDMWAWSCAKNARADVFQNEVSYDLICRLQNWSLVCAIIEVVVELITICVYGIVFYRFWSKRQLRKSMAVRDRARSDMYLAQLRAQSAPNTPGPNGPMSARDGGWRPPADYYNNLPTVEEGNVQYVDPDAKPAAPAAQPFKLQPPPIRIHNATPKMQQLGFTPVQPSTTSPVAGDAPRPRTPSPEVDQQSPLMMSEMPRQLHQQHFAAAPGEQVYEDVAIPGAYEAPLSPGAEDRHFQYR